MSDLEKIKGLMAIVQRACILIGAFGMMTYILLSEAPSHLLRFPGHSSVAAAEKPRMIVSSDIGGSDPDDFQSMVHYLVYTDLFDTEGLISSPPGAGRKAHILEAIDRYQLDYTKLRSRSSGFPAPDSLRGVTKQGAYNPAPSSGYSTATEGSNWIIQQAQKSDSRPLWIVVWGSITDVAQAVRDAPSIKGKIRVYSIGSWNTSQDPNARNYLYNNHPDLWWIENDFTFRGMYLGGNQSGDLGNDTFVSTHVKGHGSLGDYFYSKKTTIKMGDTPSVLYLLSSLVGGVGNRDDPTRDSWGGKFKKTGHGSNYWTDINDDATLDRVYVNQWREQYLRHWQQRMDWCLPPTGLSSPSPPQKLRLLGTGG